MRCPNCDSKRVFHEVRGSEVRHCRKCGLFFKVRIEVVTLWTCIKCNEPILPGKEKYIGNGLRRHEGKCPKKKIAASALTLIKEVKK